MIITIDGPVASGKTTVARLLAEKLGFYYLGSGLLYRALAYLLRTECGYTDSSLKMVRQEDVACLLDPHHFSYSYDARHKERIFFKGKEIVISALRTPTIAHDASMLATHGVVRQALGTLQRIIADDHNVVVEGRDAGSVVFHDADIKFFITATVAERARRWQQDQAAQGVRLSFNEAVVMVERRDARDKGRVIDPLVVPERAIIIDTTALDLEQVVMRLQEDIQQQHKMHA